MARLAMLGHPAAGHINPTLPVIAELVRRGERVTYYATEPFRARIEATGAKYRCYGTQEAFERNLAQGGMLGGMAGLMETTEELLPELLEQLAAERIDYLALEAHALWGNLAAQRLGKPAATLCAMFAVNRELLPARELAAHLYGGAPAAAALEGLRGLTRYVETARRVDRAYGVNSPDMINYLGNRQRLNIVLTAREFQVGGESFDPSYEFVGATALEPPAETFAWPGQNGQRRVLIALGTMYNDAPEFYRHCCDAFGGGEYAVVMAVGERMDPRHWPAAPPGFQIQAFVPQRAALAGADLFLTHGGINSAHEAMLAGVPMLVLPSQADHYIVAQQVGAVGAGVVLERRRADAATLRAAAIQVLGEPACRQSSARMGEYLRAGGGARRAADHLLAFRGTAA